MQQLESTQRVQNYTITNISGFHILGFPIWAFPTVIHAL